MRDLLYVCGHSIGLIPSTFVARIVFGRYHPSSEIQDVPRLLPLVTRHTTIEYSPVLLRSPLPVSLSLFTFRSMADDLVNVGSVDARREELIGRQSFAFLSFVRERRIRIIA